MYINHEMLILQSSKTKKESSVQHTPRTTQIFSVYARIFYLKNPDQIIRKAIAIQNQSIKAKEIAYMDVY